MRLWLLVLALSTAVLAQPQLEGVDFTVAPTLGDKYRSGLPLPLTVTVTNRRQETVEVKVVAETVPKPNDGARAETTLTMAAGSKHTAQLLLPYVTYSPSVYLEVNGRATASKPFSSNYAETQDVITLLLTPTATGFDYLGGYSPLLNGGELRTTRPDSVANLPICWEALAGVDMIVLYDRPNLHLAPAAEQALADWTRAGGALVLVSALDPGEYRGGALEKLLPLEPEQVTSSDRRSYLAGPLRQARVLLEEEGHPLVVAGRRDAGQVFLITTPVLTQDSLENQLTEQVWAYLLHEFRWEGSPIRGHRFDENANLLARPPELPMPSAATLSWYLIGYVLLVGPINYGILRRKDRMLWVVFTVPLIALGFSAGAYFTNSWSRSAQTVVREVGLVHLADGSRHALLDGSQMVFSPRGRRYDLESTLSCYGRPRGTPNNYGYSNGEEANYRLELTPGGIKLADFSATMWSARHFRSLDVRELSDPVRLAYASGRLELRSPCDLTGATLIWGGLSQPFSVKKNQRLKLQPTVEPIAEPPGKASALAEQLKAALKTRPAGSWQGEDVDSLAQLVTQTYEPCLVGWAQEEWPSGLQLKDSGARRHRLSLVVIHPEPKLAAPAPMLRPKPSPGASP